MADRPVYILGTDPGFASFGYAVVRLTADFEEVVTVNVIRTKKSPKKQNVLSADDNFRRARAVAAVLGEVLDEFRPMAISAEAISFPRNASAAAKVAMAWGILADQVEIRQIPLVQATPQAIKKSVCPKKKTATKEDIRQAMIARYGREPFGSFMESLPEGQWEHGFDSVASIVTCLNSDVIQMARKSVA